MPVVRHDGCDLHYDIAGKGPPVVFASGLGGTAAWWQREMPLYAQHYRCLAFDQRGTGRSSHVQVRSVEQMAADLVAILDHAGIQRAHVVGHSTGGAIGVAMALDHPPEVQGSRLDAILAFDRRADMHRINIPVRVIVADDDILTPRYFAEQLVQHIPGAEAAFTPRGGHALSRSEPAVFDSLVLPFLAKVTAA